MSKEQIKLFLMENQSAITKEHISCSDILDLKDQFYKEFGKKPRISEAIIYTWLHFYINKYTDGSNKRKVVVKPETKFSAKFGNQTLDISVLEENTIKLGVSIKMSTSTSAYLDGADFINPFFDKYRKHFVKDEEEYERKRREGKRIGVPTLLQDMARIENLKSIRPYFPSITIVYSGRKPKDSFWIQEFEKLGHSYIFLKESLDVSFIEVLKSKFPSFANMR
ncbi:TPA: hypothetical protein G9C53_004987 [Salmonella enterica subsp. enterica serovar Typhimurium var. 5-]|uniref:Uncharacterized protein n=1 Tax=Salmonella enterica subsp. enterica serovar Typhimurium var. 5- TaxID=1620419 RepID=A0A740TUI5_SALTM|nr:hypothetical protein [Salmonella enterica subsp. enterica serovar Typhimurium var. 5-]